MLQHKMNHSNIRGLRIARTAPAISNLLYADDLLLMGTATRMEASTINAILQRFCNISGQQVSPDKSKLWFSNNTSLARIRAVLRIFWAPFADNKETYMGSPIEVSRPSVF